MKLTAISGYGVKGPACFLFECDGRRILLDIGRGPDGDALPDLTGVGAVDAIVISHGHADHTGGLHLAGLIGNPPVFAPEPAIALAQDPLMQAATPFEDLTEICDIPFLSGLCGHAPGARWLRLGGAGGLLYTGDTSCESTLYRWSAPPPAQALVFDASYGVADQPLAAQIESFMALTDRPLLLPVPAGGRGLEMAMVFLAAGLPVSLCPSHREVAAVMVARPEALTEGSAAHLSELLRQTAPLTADSPAQGVMIAAGPNAERGVTAALAPRFIAEGSARVVFSGHVAKGMPSATMVARQEAQFLRWNVHPTLTETRAVFAACAPSQAMAAFCKPAQAHDLGQVLWFSLAQTPEMVW